MAARLSARLRAYLCVTTTLALVSTPVLAPSVLAHGDHGGGGGTVLPAGITLVTFDVDSVKYRPISDARLTGLATQGLDGVHSLKSIAVPSISIGYGVTNDLTLGVRLPYLANREIRETDVENASFVQRGGVYGIGDTTVTATYRFLREGSAGIDVSAILGVKVPTGRNDALDKQGVAFETEHQPGSGSWDGLFGLAVSKQIGVVGVSGNVLYALAGDGDRATNLGDRFSYGVGVSYRVWTASGGGGAHMHLGADRPDGIMHHGGPHAHDEEASHPSANPFGPMALDFTLGINGDWHDRQTIAGVRDDNTGGNVVYVSPGVRLSNERTTTAVTFGIPVATSLNGYQSEPDWRLNGSFGVKF